MTRDQVAEELDVARTYLDTLCRGESRPGLDLAFRIEKLTDGEISASDWVNARVHRG